MNEKNYTGFFVEGGNFFVLIFSMDAVRFIDCIFFPELFVVCRLPLEVPGTNSPDSNRLFQVLHRQISFRDVTFI
jgi:hypothetical protein